MEAICKKTLPQDRCLNINQPTINWVKPETSEEIEAEEYFTYSPHMRPFLEKLGIIFDAPLDLENWVRNYGKVIRGGEISKPVTNYPTPTEFVAMLREDMEYLEDWENKLSDVSIGNHTMPMPIAIDIGESLYALTGNRRWYLCKMFGLIPDLWVVDGHSFQRDNAISLSELKVFRNC